MTYTDRKFLALVHMTMFRPATLGLMALCLMPSCKKGDKEPAYVQLGTVSVAPASAAEGTGSEKITDLWVFADDEALGVWESGSRVPVLREGTTNLQLIAGIWRNGVRDDRIQYPYYATWNQSVELSRLSTFRIDPTFEYFPNVSFWIEDFESIGYRFEKDLGDTTMNVITDPSLVFEGNASGEIYVDEDHPFVRLITSETIDIQGNEPVFLELDHRNDHRFLIGTVTEAFGTVSITPYLFVAPTLRADGGMPWNKIYVDLSSLLNQPGAMNKKFYIEVQLQSGYTEGTIYVDNFKLVYR
ncbi:MAG: hypothetical protein KDB88_07210 [Flavobacteriales bacterium]|nr:hypothetical protein [Flavobacteriales bacterium]